MSKTPATGTLLAKSWMLEKRKTRPDEGLHDTHWASEPTDPTLVKKSRMGLFCSGWYCARCQGGSGT